MAKTTIASAPIPFTNQQSSGLEELGGASPFAANIMVEPTGAVRQRPGIAMFCPVQVDPTAIVGVHATYDGRVFAVGSASTQRQIWKVTTGGAVRIGNLFGEGVLGTARPVFAETEMLLVIAGGANLQKLELSNETSSRLAGTEQITIGLSGTPKGGPLQASHVLTNASRLLANDLVVDRTKVNYSEQAQGTATFAGFETWGANFAPDGTPLSGFFTAEARADPVVAIAENTNEVFVWGTESLQVFNSDATLIFAPSTTAQYGLGATYSVVAMDGQFGWLDNLRRIVISDARSLTDISAPIKATLDAMPTVSDCYGFRYLQGPFDVLVWVFPTAGRAFAFQKGAGWSEWLGWNDAGANWSPLPITSHFLNYATNQNLVGTSSGFVGVLTTDAKTDLGTRINARVVSGFVNHNTDERKQCQCVRFSFRRGQSGETPGPQAYFSYRDDLGPFCQPIAVDLGATGDSNPVLEFRSLGVYRRRQWKFEFSGTEALTLLGAIEDYEVLQT